MQIPPFELRFEGCDDWQAGLERHILSYHCSVVDAKWFRCQAIVAHLYGNTVAEMRVDAARLERRAIDIDGADRTLVKVMWQLTGRSRIHQGRNNATLDAGTWAICDPGREYSLDFDKGARFLLMLLPHAQCSGWLSALGTLSAQALPACGPAHIAKTVLSAMLRDVAHLDGESERTLHESVIALVHRAVSFEMCSRGMLAQSERSMLLTQVKAYMLEHLADHTLTVERVATVFAMSRRSLYNLFELGDVSPHVFIRNARLDRACSLLTDPTWCHAQMAHIALQCGFPDPAHFSRAFHARHGVAPSAWRELSLRAWREKCT
ncbi:AraC family transcriptional regulator [Cupriavidus basilensis]|uniref:AraC family transcriptional regulator n=1 Tax=Cupriavidus basilensis TaxID=68895 RepID=A0ABT6B565_9BURK|nr:AraC family transcriptional regulator [Cupriavidus basilensis]MDF3839874.1 AraC family transcriptional regulator [Cupriavidus basilensis]